MKKFVPTYYASSIFDIDISFFVKKGYKCILTDLDNTLDVYNILIPSDRVFLLKKKLDEANIKLCIVSNNKQKRKGIYPERLGIEAIFSSRKPFSKRISAFIKKLGYNKNEVILVGDQILTDVACGNNAGIDVILTDPISKIDQPVTKFNRLIDKPLRKRLHKKKILEGVKISYEQ